jgi:hypothetical protein
MRSFLGLGLVSSLVVCGVACGGSGDTPPVAATDFGFNKPDASLKANMDMGDDNWVEVGPADFSCLNTPASDLPTTVAVTLQTEVRDFQSDNLVPGAMINVFHGQDESMQFDSQVADDGAQVAFTIPIGTTRFGYKMIDPESLDTLLLNQKVDPNEPLQTEGNIRSVSKSTAATLPALIGISRTPGTGVLAGAMRDCQDREVSGFIAAVSTTSGVAASPGAHADVLEYVDGGKVSGADTYYFSSSVGLPVRHRKVLASGEISGKSQGSEDGLFMVVELASAPDAFVQVWGYLDDAALAADELTLVAELHTESIPDTVITGSYEPLRSE